MQRLRANPSRVVQVERHGSTTRPLGVVHRVGRVWVQVRVIDDLRFDGWEWLRRADFVRVERTTGTRFADRVLTPGAVEGPTPALASTAALLTDLPAKRLVILECEADGDFLLGRILSVEHSSAVVHAIDSAGRWFDHATRVDLDDVSRVHLGSQYARTYERHGDRWRPPRENVRTRAQNAD
jgi:hypothetical protein